MLPLLKKVHYNLLLFNITKMVQVKKLRFKVVSVVVMILYMDLLLIIKIPQTPIIPNNKIITWKLIMDNNY